MSLVVRPHLSSPCCLQVSASESRTLSPSAGLLPERLSVLGQMSGNTLSVQTGLIATTDATDVSCALKLFQPNHPLVSLSKRQVSPQESQNRRKWSRQDLHQPQWSQLYARHWCHHPAQGGMRSFPSGSGIEFLFFYQFFSCNSG